MPFLQLTLSVGHADPAPFEEALFEVGASAVSLTDAADNPILEPKPGELPLWPTVIVTALFRGGTNEAGVLAALQSHFAALPPHTFAVIEDRAWEREWLKDFKPMRFGQRLWICPGGMAPPSDLLLQPTAHGLQPCLVDLDPGLAFGTGTHPTTALCMEWLDGADLTGKRVIDYGCGSGILAIAALKLGAREALGTDIDPQALLASRDNAERNSVSNTLVLQTVDQPIAPADLLLANILAGPLAQLAPTFATLVKPGGHVVLSGILQDQAPALAQTYLAWFDMEPIVIREGWARLVGCKRSR